MAQMIGGGSSRLSDATYIDQVDDGVQGLEEDYSEIFGVPLNTSIASPIFRYYNSATLGAVQSDGSVDGEIFFKTASASGPSGSPGPVWHNVATAGKWKLCPLGANFALYKYDFVDEQWDFVLNVNENASGVTLLRDLTDVDPPSGGYGLPGNEGLVLALDPTGSEMEWISVAAGGGGAVVLPDLSDVDSYTSALDAEKVLAVHPTLNKTYWKTLSSAAAAAFTDLTDTYPDVAIGSNNLGSNIIVSRDASSQIKVMTDPPEFGISDPQDWAFTENNPFVSGALNIGQFPGSGAGSAGFSYPAYGNTRYCYFKPWAGTGFSTTDYWEGTASAYYGPLHFARNGIYDLMLSGVFTNLASCGARFMLGHVSPSNIAVLNSLQDVNESGNLSAYFTIHFKVLVQGVGYPNAAGSAPINNLGAISISTTLTNSPTTGNVQLSNLYMAVTRVGDWN